MQSRNSRNTNPLPFDLGVGMAFWIYILQCADGSFYTGHSEDLDRRLAEHANGISRTCYTYRRRPVTLVFAEDFQTRDQALAAERQIKGWSRAKKAAMIAGDWSEVSRLARGRSN